MGWNEQIGFPVLSVLTFLPALGAVILLLFGKGRPLFYKIVSLAVTLVSLGLAVWMLLVFEKDSGRLQFTESFTWVDRFNIRYGMGIDGIAALLLFLTTLLGAIVIVASWNYVKDRERGFFAALLLLQTGMIGVFCATDVFLFYVFWEAMLVPMYFLIGIWGGPRKIYAAIKFFLFTLVGSLLMLVAIVVTVLYARDTLGCLHLRHQAARRAGLPVPHPVLGLPRLLPRLRDQGARCGRSTPGCPTLTSRRRPPAR